MLEASPNASANVAEDAVESRRDSLPSSKRASLRNSLRNTANVARWSAHRMSLDMALDLNEFRSSSASMNFLMPRSPADRMAELKA